MKTSIEFEPPQSEFLSKVFVEIFEGDSTEAIQNILGDALGPTKQTRASIEGQLKASGKSKDRATGISIKLPKQEWRIVYDSINAVMYGLGPFELQNCTGFSVQDALNVNLRICSKVFQVYSKIQWET